MTDNINIMYPKTLANSMRLTPDEFDKELKTISLVKLYEIGKVSSGTAAKVLNISRVEFLELLSDYKVSILSAYDTNDLKEDLNNA